MEEKNNGKLTEEILREREQELAKREEQLKEKEERLKNLNAKESFYENFRSVPVKYFDYLIIGCTAAIIICVVLGMLKGRGIF